MSQDVQYEPSTSSVHKDVHCKRGTLSNLEKGSITQRHFLNESLVLSIYQLKMVNSLWETEKIN